MIIGTTSIGMALGYHAFRFILQLNSKCIEAISVQGPKDRNGAGGVQSGNDGSLETKSCIKGAGKMPVLGRTPTHDGSGLYRGVDGVHARLSVCTALEGKCFVLP